LTSPLSHGWQGADTVWCMHHEQAAKSTIMLEVLAEEASVAK
jgi:hypothetical protein